MPTLVSNIPWPRIIRKTSLRLRAYRHANADFVRALRPPHKTLRRKYNNCEHKRDPAKMLNSIRFKR